MKTTTLRHLLLPALALGVALLTHPAQAVGTRRFELSQGKDFKGGDLKGVAVDGAGRVHAGLNLGNQPVSDAQAIWDALPQADGSVLLATGNEGKLLELRGGATKVLAETKALVLTSLAEAWGGDVLAGALPTGEVLRYRRGKLETLVKLEGAEHVWDIAYDAAEKVAYAATGPEGKLFRIDQSGQAQVHFDAEEAHLMSVAVAPGRVYAGSSDKAKLYEVRGAGRANVLHDFGRTEVRAIVVAPTGDVYAIANDIKSGSSIPTEKSSTKSTSRSKAAGKGVLYRFSRDGVPEQLLEDDAEHYTSLAN
jgi:hypothetical protein